MNEYNDCGGVMGGVCYKFSPFSDFRGEFYINYMSVSMTCPLGGEGWIR